MVDQDPIASNTPVPPQKEEAAPVITPDTASPVLVPKAKPDPIPLVSIPTTVPQKPAMSQGPVSAAAPRAPEAPHDPAHAGHVESELPRLRTFADDLSEEIKKKGATVASIVQAERERAAREIALEPEENTKAPAWKNPLLLSTALVLVAVGIVGLLGAYLYSSFVATVEPTVTPSIIFPNKVVTQFQPAYQTLSDTYALERGSVNLSLGEVERVDVTLAQASTTPQEILRALTAPEELIREAKSVMVGIHSFNRNQPFIIIEVTQYDRAYGAMLRWEEEMGRALGNFYKPDEGTVPPTLTFTDKVFQNVDTRVSQKEWPILYAFPRRDVLVITTNQYTLSEILTRLNAQGTDPTQ